LEVGKSVVAGVSVAPKVGRSGTLYVTGGAVGQRVGEGWGSTSGIETGATASELTMISV